MSKVSIFLTLQKPKKTHCQSYQILCHPVVPQCSPANVDGFQYHKLSRFSSDKASISLVCVHHLIEPLMGHLKINK